MFGQNKIMKQDLSTGDKLYVKEIFPTIQGEGPFAGRPSVFIRLAGCNLACRWCDTDFEGGDLIDTADIADTVEALAHDEVTGATLVVITGGEPFRQNLTMLVDELLSLNYDVQIETAGTLWLDNFEAFFMPDEDGSPPPVTIVVSPKTGKVHPMIARYASAWKYIIEAGKTDPEDGLPSVNTQGEERPLKLARPPEGVDVYVQACDMHDTYTEEDLTNQNMQEALKSAMTYGYYLSVQIHKIIGVD